MVLIMSRSLASPSATIFSGVSAILNSRFRCLVDAHVRRLRGERDGHQQGVRIEIIEFALRLRVVFGETLENFFDFRLVHEGLPDGNVRGARGVCGILVNGRQHVRPCGGEAEYMYGGAETDFSARLTPHRSLGPRGFLILMGIISAVSFVAGMIFWLAGAWPVVGFFGPRCSARLHCVQAQLCFRTGLRNRGNSR